MEGGNILRGTGGSSKEAAADPLTRVVDEGAARHGVSGLRKTRNGLFPYDRREATKRGGFRVGADTTDRMRVGEAAEALAKIHRIHGVDKSMENVLGAHDEAMFICYAFNGASQLGEYDRASYFIRDTQGVMSTFEYKTVFTVLGVDMRRFFRAYANEVVDACKYLYEHCDMDDEEMVDLRAQMIALSDKRGVSRFPWLIADCVEAATNLGPNERAAGFISKTYVVGNTANSVDGRNLAKPVRSLDNQDSSTGRSIPASHDIHGGGGGTQYYS